MRCANSWGKRPASGREMGPQPAAQDRGAQGFGNLTPGRIQEPILELKPLGSIERRYTRTRWATPASPRGLCSSSSRRLGAAGK